MFNTFRDFLELREMSPPQYEDKELLYYMDKMDFYSNETLADDFISLLDEKMAAKGHIVVCIRKDRKSAIIGKRVLREHDKKLGIYVFGELEFKKPDIGDNEPTNIKDSAKVLQVAGVEILRTLKRRGYGYLLYFTLIKSGYIIISDNVQYLGGKELWQKISRESKFSDYKVYVMDDGKYRRDNDRRLIYYNGSNIQDSELWSNRYEHYHTLFVAVRD